MPGVMADTVKTRISLKVLKADKPLRYVYGWASVAKTKDGRTVVDLQGDVVDVHDLETAAAGFVKEYRQGGEMHRGGAPNQLIASMVFTPELKKAMGVEASAVPEGWLVGFQLPESSFAKVKDGDLLMFSIEGEADKETIEVEGAA